MKSPVREHAAQQCGNVTKTVVVVDDDVLVRESLSALLEAYGYGVSCFSGGLELLAAQLPELSCILLDLNMPGCSGLEVLSRWRDGGRPMPPVILMTGNMPQLAAGARICLRKPIRPDDLLAEIDLAFEDA